MRAHLSLSWATHADRASLGWAEGALLELLDPPLNLQGMSATPIRVRLRALRRQPVREDGPT